MAILENYSGTAATSVGARACDSGETPVKFSYGTQTGRDLLLTGAGRTYTTGMVSLVGTHYRYGSAVGDVRADCSVYVATVIATSQYGVFVRSQNSDGDNPHFYLFRFNESGSTYELYRANGDGSFDALGSNIGGGVSAGNAYDIGLEVAGSGASVTLTRYIGGVAQTPVVDSSGSRITANGHAGVYVAANNTSDAAGPQLDQFTATPTGAPTAFTLTGPSAGPAAAASAPFTVTLDDTADLTYTFTPAGTGCTFSPSSPQITVGNTAVTFTCTRAAGTATVSVTDDAALSDPAGVSYAAVATTARTYTVDGGEAATTTGFTVRNDDGTDFAARTTAVTDQGGGSYSKLATVPADLSGVVVWDQGGVLASEPVDNRPATGGGDAAVHPRVIGG